MGSDKSVSAGNQQERLSAWSRELRKGLPAGRILRGHTPGALWPERRDGPISMATWRARRNPNDLAAAHVRVEVTEMPKVAKFLVG